MEYFIRLTPDRQSKSGYCWNDNSINSSKWVTQVKFRISGQVDYFHLFFIQGDNLYGDGMTIFFTTKGYHDNVSFFLFLIIFRVICMVLMIISLVLLLIFLLLRILVYFIFPSFFIMQYIRYHRDVSLYIGNNTVDSVYNPNEFHSGCFANYRYHEKRQDFNVFNRLIFL